jgi:hypothetical protein
MDKHLINEYVRNFDDLVDVIRIIQDKYEEKCTELEEQDIKDHEDYIEYLQRLLDENKIEYKLMWQDFK